MFLKLLVYRVDEPRSRRPGWDFIMRWWIGLRARMSCDDDKQVWPLGNRPPVRRTHAEDVGPRVASQRFSEQGSRSTHTHAGKFWNFHRIMRFAFYHYRLGWLIYGSVEELQNNFFNLPTQEAKKPQERKRFLSVILSGFWRTTFSIVCSGHGEKYWKMLGDWKDCSSFVAC